MGECKMLDYRNKIICAPMVRIGNLPFRLLCLKYGADIVYTDEIIDYKLVRCERFVNDALGTIDYISDEDHVVFRTCKEEKDKLVLQVGTNCPDRALKAAKLVEQDISGFDINMGCPKTFSVKGGMGSALLDEPEKIKKILTNLVENLSIPVTCKVRVLPSLEDTIELCKMIESTGVAAIAIHGRTRPERPHHKNRTDYIAKITEVLKIPVIANGESENINSYEDVIEFRKKANASSVMLARAARDNCSIFRTEGKLDRNIVIGEYLDLCMKYENYFSITKFTVQCMMGFVHEGTGNAEFHASTNMRDLCKLWHKEDEYDRIAAELKAKNSEQLKRFAECDPVNQPANGHQTNGGDANNADGIPSVEQLNGGKELESRYNPLSRKRKLIELIKNEVDADEIANLQFVKLHFPKDNQLPKNVLYKYATENQKRITYRTMPAEKRFYCVCDYDGTKYMSSYLEKNKRLAEQASALVACAKLNLIDKEVVAKCEVDKLLIDPTLH